jgi:hypothetical protein
MSTDYMPNDNSDLTADILASVSNYVCNKDNSVKYIIVAGDFNCCMFDSGGSCYDTLVSFQNDTNLHCTASFLLNNGLNDYTYCHESLGHRSLIDYIFVSRNLLVNIDNVSILHSGSNFSDHSPVSVKLKFNDQDINVNKNSNNHFLSSCPEIYSLRWDKADLYAYYESTRITLMQI